MCIVLASGAEATTPEWPRLTAELKALRHGGSQEAIASRLTALEASLPAESAPYPVRREILLLQMRADDADQTRLRRRLRELAQASGDADTADWMRILDIFDAHSDADIRASLRQLDALRLRIDERNSLDTRQALESSYAYMYWDVGSLELAMRHLLRAHALAVRQAETAPERAHWHAITLAGLYLDMRDPTRALETLTPLDALAPARMSLRLRVALAASKGAALRAQGRLTQAGGVLEDGLALVDNGDAYSYALHLRAEVARLRLAQGRASDALAQADALAQMSRQAQMPYFSAESQVLRGVALAQVGRLEAGLAELARGIAHFRDASHLLALRDALDRQSDLLQRAGRTAQALAVANARNELSMAIYTDSQALSLASLRIEQKVAERDQRIRALSSANVSQARQLRDQRQRMWLLVTGLVCAGIVLLLLGALLYQMRRQRQALWRDALTGAHNRHYFNRWIASHPLRGGQARMFLLLDADHFKTINDRHGHEVGDRVLAELASRLRRIVRSGDGLFRWGGEEFLLVLDAAGEAALEASARRLLQSIEHSPFMVAGLSLEVTASAGFVLCRGPACMPWDDAIRAADAALYMAKARGRRQAVGLRRVGSGSTDQPAPATVEAVGRWIEQRWIQPLFLSAAAPVSAAGQPARPASCAA